MFSKTLSFVTPNYGKLNWKVVLSILFVVALFIRFPFFFRDYIDRDESTFILMGQSWVNGHLPYTQLWDLKPPITFLFFALIIKIFGKSFIAIRFFGTVLVVLTAWFTYLIGLRITSKKISFWCALGCVGLLSLFGSLQGVMSEHISTLFFIMGVYVLLSKKHLAWHFAAGVLLGLSILSKLNMAYPFLVLGLYMVWSILKHKEYVNGISRLLLMGLGFITLVVLTALPYYLENEIGTWWASIFEAPIAYSSSKLNSPLKTLPLVLFTLVFYYFTFKKRFLDYHLKDIQVLLIVFSGVVLSFVQAGKLNGHYLIQVYPFILLPVGMVVARLPEIKKRFQPLLLLLILVPMESYLEYVNVISNKMERGTFYNGEGVEVPRFILENRLENRSIFFTEYHIGYWMLNILPPTIASTHPSNITREELFPYMNNPRKTAIQELSYIMEDVRPEILVARKGKKIFDKKRPELNAYIENYLEEHYTLLKTVDRGLIYQLSE